MIKLNSKPLIFRKQCKETIQFTAVNIKIQARKVGQLIRIYNDYVMILTR